MEKEAIEKWIEEYVENTIHITVDKKISLLDPRNGMLPRDLLQLYFAVESYLDVYKRQTFTRRYPSMTLYKYGN